MFVMTSLTTSAKAIEFAKEQADDDLWEDLLRYSETRPGMFLLIPAIIYASFLAVQLSLEGYWRMWGLRSIQFG